MIIEHKGRRPAIHETAYIAPNAVVCGDVSIGENCRVLFGAVINGDEGAIEIGSNCIIMESAIIKGAGAFPTRLKDCILVGARAYLSGCVIEENVNISISATILNNSTIGERAEIGINSLVYANTHVPADTILPIGHVALGSNPTHILPAGEQGKIWHIARQLDFSQTLWNIPPPAIGTKETIMPAISRHYIEILENHRDDKIIK